ncbi:TetR/AcrR family transcriptional regulator C-terminal domain-containing protein [Blastococcus sp. BMG 814]|uniref:TetR/AcrR family transcriptional regulator C-terminal domain-containing protein n=1 Tax=Blastococcus carthaginiensis TaxID=3050034 RepID=A0ABT9I8V7_9ACTN|nr:TetR/AcrR family transcriptional regulator C-terminal domain-containing protein [Blastococcus carthaginiensis]MDP5182009.1 TetR/AcrR family transcriptional regulator C-terminal domain-containing protein [Blastococcus carthaginiensis]
MGRRSDLALTRDGIARTALAILDEEGAAALTVRRLAARLGVQSPSLYNHLRSKDEILHVVIELIDGEIDRDCLDDPDWRRGITAFAHSYRRAFQAHPAALSLIARQAVETEQALRVYDAALAALLRAGWPPERALQLLASIEYLALGSALVPFTGGFTRPPAEYAGRYPSLALALGRASDLAAVDDVGFERGLAALLREDPPG